MLRTRLVLLAALSLTTAAIHASVVREHLDEYAPFGVFFAALAAAEVGAAVLLARSPTRRALTVIGVGNLAIAVLWAVSRTGGLPIGAEHWAAEPVQLKDSLSTVAECFLAIGSMPALHRSPIGRRHPAGTA